MDNFLSDRLRKARESAGYNQLQIAELLGKTPATVNRYEKGHRVPDAEYIAQMVRVTSCSGTWLLTGKGEMFEGGGQGSQPGGLHKELVRVVIEAVEEGLNDLQLELKPDKKAELVITLCEMFQEEKQVDKPTILRLIKLAA